MAEAQNWNRVILEVDLPYNLEENPDEFLQELDRKQEDVDLSGHPCLVTLKFKRKNEGVVANGKSEVDVCAVTLPLIPTGYGEISSESLKEFFYKGTADVSKFLNQRMNESKFEGIRGHNSDLKMFYIYSKLMEFLKSEQSNIRDIRAIQNSPLMQECGEVPKDRIDYVNHAFPLAVNTVKAYKLTTAWPYKSKPPYKNKDLTITENSLNENKNCKLSNSQNNPLGDENTLENKQENPPQNPHQFGGDE